MANVTGIAQSCVDEIDIEANVLVVDGSAHPGVRLPQRRGLANDRRSGRREQEGAVAKRKSSGPPEATAGAKMIYLIKRRDTATREELLVHWFANHMPPVIKSQHDAAAAGRLHARRYIATLFDANAAGEHPWDGAAQLWWIRRYPSRRHRPAPRRAIRFSKRRSRTSVGPRRSTS